MKAMRRLGWTMAVGGATMLALSGCATTNKMMGREKVTDEMVARVPQDRLGAVNEGRTEVQKLEQDANRAKVRHEDAGREVKIAEEQNKAVRQEMKAAQMAQEHAQKVGAADSEQAARQQMKTVSARQQAADADLAMRQEREKATELQQKLSEAKLEDAKARLQLAEFRAVRDSGEPKAKKMNEGDFTAKVEKSQREVNQLEGELQTQNQKLAQAEEHWRQTKSAAESGVGGSGKSGLTEEGTGGAGKTGKSTKSKSKSSTTKSKSTTHETTGTHDTTGGTPDSSTTH